jgi:hypothetical protein
VLQVGEEPVEPGEGAGLGGQRGTEAEERAVQGGVSPEARRLDRSVIHGFLPEPLRMSGRWSGGGGIVGVKCPTPAKPFRRSIPCRHRSYCRRRVDSSPAR